MAKVEITQTTVAPNADLKEVVKVTDALGRDVSAEHAVTFESADSNIVNAEGKAQPNTAGKSVIVEAVVKDGKNTIKSGKVSIKVQAAQATTFVGSYVATTPVADTEKFEEVKAEDKINYVHMGTKNQTLGVYFNDQYGKSMNVLAQETATITNLTPATVIVDDEFNIQPISEGTGYVKVKVGEVEKTIAIEVKAQATAAEMNLDKSEVSVVAGKAAATVKADFKDQFGNKIDPAGAVTIKKDVTDEKIAKAVVDGKSVTITGVAEGTTTVTVEFKVGDKTLSKDIKVTVAKAGDLAKYDVNLKDAKLDLGNTDKNKDKAPQSTTLVVNEVDVNGNVLGAATATLTEVDKDGNEVTEDDKKLLTIKENKNVIAKAKGTAYVQVKVGSLVIDTVTVEVVNTAAEATSVDFDRLDVAITDVKTTTGSIVEPIDINKALKPIIKIVDQNGKVMKDQDGKDIEATNITFTTANAVGLELGTGDNAGKINKITNAAATVDVVVTGVTSGASENLLTKPVVVKLSLKQFVVAVPADAKTTVDVADLTAENAKFLVAGLVQEGTEGPQVPSTLDEVKSFIDGQYNVNFNKDAIKIENGKISIVGSVLSTADWYKVKANGTNTIPYKITLNGTDKKVKIAMYANGTSVIEDTRSAE